MSLTAEEKLRVVHALDALGVHMIEAGFPSSNPKEEQLFALLAEEHFETSEIVAFGMTRRREIEADAGRGAADPGGVLRAGLHARRQVLGPARREGRARLARGEPGDDRRVGRVPRPPGQARAARRRALLRRLRRSIPATRSTARAPPPTPGPSGSCCATPTAARCRRRFASRWRSSAKRCRVFRSGIHTHDDSGCAVANTLTAVEGGATQVQGTINGIGERTGNANLVTIIADLQLKLGYELLAPERLARLTETAHLVDELLNRAPNPAQPYVGKHAFAHKAGLHAAGVRADAQTFEHIDPARCRQRPRRARLRALRARHRDREGARGRHRARRRRRPAHGRARQGSSSIAASSSRPPTARSSC